VARARGGRADAGEEEGAPDPIDIHVGRRIRIRRILLDMNQPGLAGKLGLTFQQVQKYENGSNRVSASRLTAISKVLGVPVEYFYLGLRDSGEPLSAEEQRWEDRIGDTDALELVRHYDAIRDRRVREHFLELVRAAASADHSG